MLLLCENTLSMRQRRVRWQTFDLFLLLNHPCPFAQPEFIRFIYHILIFINVVSYKSSRRVEKRGAVSDLRRRPQMGAVNGHPVSIRRKQMEASKVLVGRVQILPTLYQPVFYSLRKNTERRGMVESLQEGQSWGWSMAKVKSLSTQLNVILVIKQCAGY